MVASTSLWPGRKPIGFDWFTQLVGHSELVELTRPVELSDSLGYGGKNRSRISGTGWIGLAFLLDEWVGIRSG